MNRNLSNSRTAWFAAGTFACIALGALSLAACDRDVESSKRTTVKQTETPEGTKTTTEKVEKKVETERKNPE